MPQLRYLHPCVCVGEGVEVGVRGGGRGQAARWGWGGAQDKPVHRYRSSLTFVFYMWLKQYFFKHQTFDST